jgi:hypothetical protein
MRSVRLLDAVRQLNCVCCGREGVQAAHSNLLEHGKGRGIKASDAAIMALCPACHADLDAGSALTKERKKQLQYEFISKTYIFLVESGRLGILK